MAYLTKLAFALALSSLDVSFVSSFQIPLSKNIIVAGVIQTLTELQSNY